MLKLEAVNEENIWDILNLDVFAEQQEFVASNAVSLSEAYLVLKDRTDAQVFPFGIYDSDTLIGFLMIGYGKKAVELAIQFVKQFPCGSANHFWLSYEPENQVAQSLYSSFGFYQTGELDHDELIAVLDLEN
ncbi:Spermine/spermidine acetyltransferase [Streptococcus pluranimalium]|uniref:GNAT family N-acetyltransferase n=1 Tax=Streptococcus pluranimalium TaxID=82348 RepID=UPI0039ECEC20